MAQPPIVLLGLEAFFDELVEHALAQHREVELSAPVHIYLLDLLERFAHEGFGLDDTPLVLLLEHAQSLDDVNASAVLRRAGDSALFLSGFFLDNLKRRNLNAAYARTLGAFAYSRLAALGRAHARLNADLYQSLARRFDDLVLILRAVSAQIFGLSPSSAETIQALDLIQRGLLPSLLNSGGE